MCDSLISPGNNFVVYSPGKYIDTAFSGCGGTIHYFETYRKSTSSQINERACKAYTSPSGKIFTQSGVYRDTLTSATYCGYDSIIRIALTMKPSYTETVNLTACDSFIARGTGQTWYSSGIYKDTIDVETAIYCDTIKTYNLSIHQTDQVKIVESCEQFISPSGKMWTATNTYYDTLINPLGCIDHFTFH
jgi:hypothetical protein